ncbi:major facilitator superfamily protein [Sarocladium implicatum]|nr:major facilitator superfamily protein [Sarocladium implicatum]
MHSSTEVRDGNETVATETPRDVTQEKTTYHDKHDGAKSESSLPESSDDYQAGVRAVEATTTTWTKGNLIAAYTIIWFIYFITSMQEVITRALNPFVTSAFQRHSLTAAISIMSSIIGGLSKLPLAKILDTWGRPQGLALTLFLWVVGFIMMAACGNVETYAAAQVFSSVGSQGVSYCLTIFIADTSSLLNRPLMLAFATSPYIVTTWMGGPITDSILSGIGWRWGFGIWTIVTPAVVLPLCALFLWNQHKAVKAGLIKPRKTHFSLTAVKNYAIQVDLFGILILAAGMALFLLPFSLWSYQGEGWRAPMIICMIIFGGLLIIAFAVWEKFFAPVKFIPYELLTDRTVFFGGLMFVFVFSNSAIWGSYFSSMLLVVWDTGVTQSTYISNIYRVGSCFASIIIAYFMRLTGRFKWVGAYYALPLMILGVGLMIHFRQANQDIGYVIMTQIFVAFAGGPIVVAGEMAMMAPSDHQHVAVIIAILDLFSSIGSALGSTVSAAIWTGTFHDALKRNLPADAPVNEIYGDLTVQMSYPVGGEIRNGINDAYSESQRYMLITSVCLLAGGFVCTLLWRDIKLREKKQVRGTVV